MTLYSHTSGIIPQTAVPLQTWRRRRIGFEQKILTPQRRLTPGERKTSVASSILYPFSLPEVPNVALGTFWPEQTGVLFYFFPSHEVLQKRIDTQSMTLTCASGTRFSLHIWGKSSEIPVDPQRKDEDEEEEPEQEEVENNALKISFLQLYFSETRSSDCKRCGQLSDPDGWESTEDEDGWGDAMVPLFIAKERAPQVVAIARNTSELASALYRQRLAKQTQHKHKEQRQKGLWWLSNVNRDSRKLFALLPWQLSH